MKWLKNGAQTREDEEKADVASLEAARQATLEIARLPSNTAFDRLCRVVVRQLATAFDASHAFVAVPDKQPGRLRTLAVCMDGEDVPNFDYELTGSPCAEVMRHGELRVVRDCRLAYPGCRWPPLLQIDAYAGVALPAPSGPALGLLVVGDRKRLPSAEVLHQLQRALGERLALELAEQPRQRRQRLAASLFDQLPQAAMLSDSEQRIVMVNDTFCVTTGWSRDAILGRRESVLGAGRDDPGLRDEIQATLNNGEIWVGELWSRRSDGEVFPESRLAVAVRGPDDPACYRLSLFSDISAEKFAAERIHRLAHYDATTELPNRVLLQDRLLHAINRVSRDSGRLALLFLDLDGFKLINDSLGHAAGDTVLRKVGERLTSRLRKADVVARVGGDEFAVVLSDVGQDSDVQAICDQLLQVITEPYPLGGHNGHVSASIGIAVFPEDGSDVPTLLKHADAAMYQAKENGKNRYAFYEPEMNRRAEQRLRLGRQLRTALERDQFSLCYQPQYDLVTGRMVAIEALVRWKDESGELVEPKRFIPLAEDTGLIVSLGAWVLEQGCRQAQLWVEQGLDFGRLAVNVSGRQFLGEGLREVVAGALRNSGLSGNYLELEITETWVMEGPYKAEKQMRALHELDVGLVIDDFGVANSSMAYLKRFPIHKLKVDRSFVRDIPGDPDDAAIVSAIIAMGHSLGLRVVAEGVENAEQSAFLRGTGCDVVQGYFYGRPVPADEMNVQLLYSPTLTPA
jgi:diguanylate cyclase (GGDEF)-like protein/PAS domain S-box-containing protein